MCFAPLRTHNLRIVHGTIYIFAKIMVYWTRHYWWTKVIANYASNEFCDQRIANAVRLRRCLACRRRCRRRYHRRCRRRHHRCYYRRNWTGFKNTTNRLHVRQTVNGIGEEQTRVFQFATRAREFRNILANGSKQNVKWKTKRKNNIASIKRLRSTTQIQITKVKECKKMH